MYTLDASVWLNADSPSEPHHSHSRALLDRIAALNETVVVPTLLLVEVAGVLSRTRGDSSLASQYANAMRKLPFIQWVPLDDAMAAQAMVIASQNGLRGADAVYAAVALANGCTLVSLAREHLTRLPAILRTLTPEDALASATQNPNP